MFHVVLVEPEIPPNAGNVARLCAATQCSLHFVGRLGFRLDDKTLKRAGLDYWPHVTWHRHESWAEFRSIATTGTIWLVDNPALQPYTRPRYQPGDWFVFGSESQGLSNQIKSEFAETLVEIPMASPHVRSLNLATSAGIVLYEALRQCHDW